MADGEKFLTIVSGLPRSGTSMMMRMLEAGGIPALIDNIRKPDEDNPRGYYEYEPVKQTRKDPSWLKHAEGRVVKMVYRLLYDLPPDYQYRVVFMRRKLEEVIASQNVMLARQAKPGGSLSDDKLMAVFRTELESVYRWLEKQPNFRVLFVDYNEIMADAGPAVDALNRFLGGNLNTAAMRNVVEPELYRQRRA
ncbi:MAG TPA: sulfotransferase family protein [Phycisphaerae bacterium]|jgi:hypothetical protein|nr:sulfotransferase family protein [Phycisphaerae bacterium]HRS29417.1 sulfotransferase family protein [Phycisphaerae bacterium]